MSRKSGVDILSRYELFDFMQSHGFDMKYSGEVMTAAVDRLEGLAFRDAMLVSRVAACLEECRKDIEARHAK